jgi:hypothetical protein
MAWEPQALLHFRSPIGLTHVFPEVIDDECDCGIQILCCPADKIYLIVRFDRSNVLDGLGDVRDCHILSQGAGQPEAIAIRQYIQLQADPGSRGDAQILLQGPMALLGQGRDGGLLSGPLISLPSAPPVTKRRAMPVAPMASRRSASRRVLASRVIERFSGRSCAPLRHRATFSILSPSSPLQCRKERAAFRPAWPDDSCPDSFLF